VVQAADADGLPFRAARFDLVVRRHPAVVVWPDIALVLALGDSYLSRQVGAGSNRELTDFMMGPQPVSRAQRSVAGARAAGLQAHGSFVCYAQRFLTEAQKPAAWLSGRSRPPWCWRR